MKDKPRFRLKRDVFNWSIMKRQDLWVEVNPKDPYYPKTFWIPHTERL